MAHTPGPWAVGFSDGTGLTYITAGDHPARKDSPVIVVSGATDDWGVEHGVRNPDDAKLIAAAPELLAFVQACETACARVVEEGGAVYAGVDFAALHSGARAAIAKAVQP